MNKIDQPLLSYNDFQRIDHSEDEDTIDVSSYLRTIAEYRWRIICITLLAALLGSLYASISKPLYESNASVQVETSVPQGNSFLNEITGAYEKKNGAGTEIEILRSRNVLSNVIDATRYDISVKPKQFPVIGPAIAWVNKEISRFGLSGLSGFTGLSALNGYVWGAENMSVPVFNVPEQLQGKRFTITVEGPNKYRVQQQEAGVDFRSQVGLTRTIPTTHGDVDISVDHIAASPGAKFFLMREFRIDAVERLQKSLKISEKGKQSGIISISLQGSDPKLIRNVVNEVGREYIRQTVTYKAEEADRSLAFLNKQLPVLKQELEKAEFKYNQVRNKHSSVDLGEESKMVVQQAAMLQTRMFELNQKKLDLQTRYMNDYPSVVTVDNQIKDIGKEIEALNSRIKRMPSIEQDVMRAMRDMKVNTELYTNLLSTAQQLRQVSASRLGGARLLDMASVPIHPVGPSSTAVTVFAGIIGLGLSMAYVLVRKKLNGELPDPNKLESRLGIVVSATIPHSPRQDRLNKKILKKEKSVSVLPYVAPEDVAVESLRGLRTLVDPEMTKASNNIILITGPTPSVGKSFVSANFAAVLASINKRIMLIDCDMRCGQLHQYFGIERKDGVSELIKGYTTLKSAIHKEIIKNVDFISTGKLTSQPAELLAHPNFGRILKALSEEYDFIVIDSAPALAFADVMTIAKHAGSIYNVVRDRVTSIEEIEETIRRLNQAGGRVVGTVFNDLRGKLADRYGYGPQYKNSWKKA